jgi:hypothetical protein
MIHPLSPDLAMVKRPFTNPCALVLDYSNTLFSKTSDKDDEYSFQGQGVP